VIVEAIWGETPGYEQEAAARGGFVLTIFCILWRAILLDFGRAPAAINRRTGGIDWTAKFRMRDLTMEFHRLTRRGRPLDCMQPN
jgi:hypothetical protein